MSDGQADDGDAQGHAGGHRPRDPVRPARVRLRDHGVAAGAGLLRHRRGHRLRAARQGRAARPRRRGEGPVREGAAAQGLFPQRPGTGRTSKSSGGPGASSQNGSNSSTKEADRHGRHSGSSWSPGRSSRRSSTAVQGPHRGSSPSLRHRGRRLCSGTSCTTGAITDGETRASDVRATSPTSSSVPRPTARRCATIVGDDPVEFAETFAQDYTGRADGSTRNALA